MIRRLVSICLAFAMLSASLLLVCTKMASMVSFGDVPRLSAASALVECAHALSGTASADPFHIELFSELHPSTVPLAFSLLLLAFFVVFFTRLRFVRAFFAAMRQEDAMWRTRWRVFATRDIPRPLVNAFRVGILHAKRPA